MTMLLTPIATVPVAPPRKNQIALQCDNCLAHIQRGKSVRERLDGIDFFFCGDACRRNYVAEL